MKKSVFGGIFHKKIITVAFCFVMFFLFAGCGKGDISKVKIDYGTSSVYSKEEMEAAVEVIKTVQFI